MILRLAGLDAGVCGLVILFMYLISAFVAGARHEEW